MPSADKTGESETYEELVEKTRGPRERIINGLRFYGGEAHGYQLRRNGDIPSGTYHFEKMEEQGLVEQTGTEYIADGGESNVYQLTDLGQEVADELVGPSGERPTADELEERLEQQAEEIEGLKQRYNAVYEKLETLLSESDAE